MTFKALLATRENKQFDCRFQQVPMEALPPGEILIRVAYSSLNYKDGLAVLGRPGVIRKFPMVPGIDLAGTVVSDAQGFHEGMEVLVTGCGLSETVWGGYAQYARVDADCAIPIPHGLTLKRAMALGTAGFTAMESILALEEHGLKPGGREVLVTGAAGGVGSCAVAMLGKLGYNVVASTGRAELSEYLKSLGATSVIDRATISANAQTGLASERWAGAVDTVGGTILAGIFPAVERGGSVAACGLAESEKLTTTVFPFILRGVNLLGINSSSVPNERRREIWSRCAKDMPMHLLDSMTVVEPLENVFQLAERILKGQIRGRVVLDVNA
jgi:acrylyl-CoA reductase (NADPH)